MSKSGEIWVGDCTRLMRRIPSRSVALIITSPPYNAGKEYEPDYSLEDYQKFAQSWVKWIPRLLKSSGSFWLNVGYTAVGPNETLPLTYLYYPLVRLKLIQEIVWHYEGGMAYKKRYAHRTERWMWFARNPEKVLFALDRVRDKSLNRTQDKRNHPLGKNPTDYWFFNRVVSGTGKVKEKTKHPCQFPEKMIERIILANSNPGDLVVDPMCGSGTVPVVAKRLGRKYLGIEINREYVEEALVRLKQV